VSAVAEQHGTKDPRQPHDTTPDDLVADVTDSDPNGNTPEGLAGGMGVSSERVAPLRGAPQDATHGAGPEHPEAPYDARDLAELDTGAVPEQNALTEGQPEIQPDLPPRTRPTAGAPNPLGPGPDFTPDDEWRTVQAGEDGEHTGDAAGRSEFDPIERAQE
jgi:hypothetical protein